MLLAGQRAASYTRYLGTPSCLVQRLTGSILRGKAAHWGFLRFRLPGGRRPVAGCDAGPDTDGDAFPSSASGRANTGSPRRDIISPSEWWH